MNKIIFTDLDGTLTLKDTYTQFILKHIQFTHIVFNIHIWIKLFILYFLGIKNGNDVKKETFKIFFSNKNIIELRSELKEFIESISWNKLVLDLIKKEQLSGTKVIIVTASPDIYIEAICNYLGYDGYISTSVERNNDMLTGKFIGKICNFDEKVKRIKSFLGSRYFYKISYGNSKGDYSMLKYCDKSFFVRKSSIIEFRLRSSS